MADRIGGMAVRRGFETACLFVLIGVVILRPLVAESYDSAGNSITRAVEEIRDPSPARTLGFDLLILVAGCGWLAVHASDPSRRYRRTGLEAGAALVAVGGVISCIFAGNKRLAINATVDWLCLPVLAIVLVQLLRERLRRGLVIAAVLGSACVQAAQCYDQYFFTSAETREEYEKHKTEFWAKQNVDLDSSTVEAFERRLNARQASGFIPHSNVTGAYLALSAFAAAGVAAGVAVGGLRRKPRSEIEWLLAAGAVLLSAAIFGAILLTKSAGAMIAAGTGAVFWIAQRQLAPWIQSHRCRVVLMAWACVAVAAVAVVGHGLHYKSLPGWSLTFRWQYWTASAEMIADHPWTGVGRENFGRHYLQYKAIESPEEVSNPHNLLVQAAADWGIAGLIGVVAMLIGGSMAAARPPLPEVNRSNMSESRMAAKAVAWTVGLLAFVVIVRLPLLGTNDPNFLFYSAMTAGLCWLLGFLIFGWSFLTESCDSTNSGGSAKGDNMVARAEGSGSDFGTAVGVGLLVLLLHETINFALFVPAAATTFFALLAVWLSGRQLAESRAEGFTTRLRMRRVYLAGAVVMVAGVGVGVVLPVNRSAGFLETARSAPAPSYAGSIEDQPGCPDFGAAAKADPLDPTPWAEKARWLSGGGTEAHLRIATESLRQGIQRDPVNASLRRAQARVYLSLAEIGHRFEDYLAAVEAEKAALALYPLDPSGLVSLGDTLFAAGESMKSDKLLHEAVDSYQRALELDSRRLPWETIRRFRRQQIADINTRIDRTQQLLNELSRL